QHRAELGRPRRPAVDQFGVGRGDVELDEIAMGRETAYQRHVVLGRFAGDADDQRHAVRQPGDGRAEANEARIREAVAVDQAGAGGARAADEVRLRVAGPRLGRDRLRGDGAEPQAHRAREDARVVVHRGEDQRIGQARPAAASGPGVSVADDTFAFPNMVRAHDPHAEHLYANYCFVLGRGLRQFHQFARFDASAPRVDADEYTRRVRAVAAHAPWQPPLPPAERVVIPGFANLRAFSAAEEASVKAGLNARFWTLVHWTNWRTTMPVPDGHQAEILAD